MIREPAVSGAFYPADSDVLTQMVDGYLKGHQGNGHSPKAIVAPHAGLVYSGSIAGSAYAALLAARDRFQSVILMGPSHRVHFHGLALPSFDAFRTPLGEIRIDAQLRHRALDFDFVTVRDDAHRWEHSLEVHLPFLQRVLGDFSLLPVVAGELRAEGVHEFLRVMADGPNTLVVVSSDLSHFHDYETANGIDRGTCEAILRFDGDTISSEQACGHVPLRGLVRYAHSLGLTPRLLDLRNSGDTAGDRHRVVGYAAIGFFENSLPAD